MKSWKSSLLIIAIIASVLFNPSESEGYPSAQDKGIKYLSAYAKLYGYIRYFHPSDEAATVDWNKFLYYGIEEVIRAKDTVVLKNTLDSLFLPIAPSIDIFFSNETPEVYSQPENIDGLVLVTWQHKGVGADPNPVFKSIRLNRLNWEFYSRFGIFQQFPINFDCGNKKFRLSAKVRTSNNGKGEIELFGHAPTGKYYHKSETFENEELKPFVLEDKFDEGVSYLVLTIRLLEKGDILIDDLEFKLEKVAGHLQPFSISNSQFITEEQGEIEEGWDSYGMGYKYNIAKSAGITSIILQSSDEFEYNSLFNELCIGNELITKDLGCGIRCRFPLALYLPLEQPKHFSESFMNLKSKLDQIQLENNSAKLEVTRIGVVITAWNIFQHFYPYFDVARSDWNWILGQTLAEVVDNKDENDLLISLRKMTAALEDGHVKIMHPSESGFRGLPIIFDYIEGQVVIAAANSDLLQKGDIILEIDGKSVLEMFIDYEKMVSGSPQWKKYKALRDFTRDDSTKVSKVKIRRGQNVIEVAINRNLPLPQLERPDNVSKIKDDVFYINLSKASIESIEDQIQDISEAKGVVFDLRGYPNSNQDVISYIIDRPVQSAKWNIPQILYPDHENIAGYDTSGRWTIEPRQPKIQGKIVFITDESAISYAESIMGIIEHYKLAEIIGSTTAGANGNVNSVTTMGGFQFRWTGMKVLKHDDKQHHLVGIKPTIPLEPTINGIREGRDELLDKAIEIVLK